MQRLYQLLYRNLERKIDLGYLMESEFSDYIVYVDESGDHGLKNIDPQYPVFVLAFCIFKKTDYFEKLMPAVHEFKFKHFGHDQVILHESDIRRDRGAFSNLKSRERKTAFLNELTDIINDTPFKLVSTVIMKNEYVDHYWFTHPANPYHVALGYGLERIYYFLSSIGAKQARTHIVFECRGLQEDQELELEFRRICDGANYPKAQLPFEIVFADKKSNSTGLQLADLVARPIGLHCLKPEQPNRAYDVINKKFHRNGGRHEGVGLKVFP